MADATGTTHADPLTVPNVALVYNTIWHKGPILRSDLVSLTGFTKSTVSAHVDSLLSHGLIKETDFRPSGLEGGRRARFLAINAESHVVAGIHVGVRQTRVILADALGRELAVHTATTEQRQPSATLSMIAEAVLTLLDTTRIPRERLSAVGVALPGAVDPVSGICRVAPNLGWRDIRVSDILSNALGVPSHVNNTAQAMAVAEAHEASRRGESTDLVLLYVGTGIGAAAVSGERLLRGTMGFAGEIGHVSVGSGILCPCGNMGCLETVASAPAIIERARAAGVQAADTGRGITAESIGTAAASGDEAAQELLAHVGRDLGLAAAWVVHTMNPRTLVVAGEFSALGDLLLEPLTQGLRQAAMPAILDTLAIRRSYLDGEGKLTGAVLTALRQLDGPSSLVPSARTD